MSGTLHTYPTFACNPTSQFEEMLGQIQEAHLGGCHQILSQAAWPQELTPQPKHHEQPTFAHSALALHKLRCHVKSMGYNPLAFIKSQGFNAHEAQAIAHAAYPFQYEPPTLAMLLG